MDKPIDRPDNTVFKYLYCNSFKWFNPLDNEIRGGHPKEKTIYRAWYNTDTKAYRILSNPGKAFYCQNLVETDSFPQDFTCNFEEVTQSNILKFKDISEENLSELLQWLEINNADLKERLGFTSPTPQQFIAIIQAPKPSEEQEQYIGTLNGFIESGEELLNTHPIAFEKIWQLIDTILDQRYEEDSTDSYQLKYSEDGKGINANDALKAINRYMGKDRRTNENPNDLYEAMTCILTELIRREYNNLDQ